MYIRLGVVVVTLCKTDRVKIQFGLIQSTAMGECHSCHGGWGPCGCHGGRGLADTMENGGTATPWAALAFSGGLPVY